MEYEIYTLEALAHYTRGGVTLFFIFLERSAQQV